MAILTHDILTNHGPYIKFADLSAPLKVADGGWPDRSLYQDDIFFHFADDLLETYCSLTQSYLFFDQYAFIQFNKPWDIRRFASEFLLGAFQLFRGRPEDFAKELSIYEGTNRFSGSASPTPEDLQHDMIETLLFIAGRLNKISYLNRTFALVGI